MTAREDLEAFIWRAMRAYRVNAPFPVPFVDAVLKAADAYSPAPGRPPTVEAIAAGKRGPLTWTDPTVHWQKPGGEPNTAICHGRITRAVVTSLPVNVTCGRCKQSRAYAAAQGVAS